ncbi:hypothetical protein [Pseudogemmobacter faecipullorum]|uniref:Uncharacterized protein n=1 Tax=Pseudogemmobacter faecipullorum TaxID=2755041 RepID=A0ABS8CM51_9RHOB|nr:hypothetical protein [Pseudogemmobacter faecipullorum]MCB5410467.1 hypothetical protein [Pseudogemmobacter faecipullorum]
MSYLPPLPMIIDSFAGGGGASTGIELALGRSPDVAINHSETALALHAVILSKQDGRIPEVDQNLRFMTLILPGVAEAIRAKKEGGEG